MGGWRLEEVAEAVRGGYCRLQMPLTSPPATPRDALEGKGPQRRPQKRLNRRLEEVAEAVGGGCCRLQMPLTSPPATPRDALEGKGPQRRPQKRLDRRLEEVAEAVGGGCCRLSTLLKLPLADRETFGGRGARGVEGMGPKVKNPLRYGRGHTATKTALACGCSRSNRHLSVCP